MMDAMWSKGFAESAAQLIGYCLPHKPAGVNKIALDRDAEAVVAEIAEAFRYLAPKQIQTALDYAEFLRAYKITGAWVSPDLIPPWMLEKLREVRDLVLFLRQRHGSEQPADESDAWTEEDQREFTAYSLKRWDEREASGGE
jgi:hypothetical protein